MTDLKKMPDSYWKKKLNSEQYRILRQKGTEPAFRGSLLNNKGKGIYMCMACGNPLFSSDTKYESGTGWPSFFDALSFDKIELNNDYSLGMHRVEVKCSKCGSHLGHLFDDGPIPTKKRFCINSCALDFNSR